MRPPKGHGWFRDDFTDIHGLTRLDVQGAPEFPAIAPEFLERLTRADIVVAHNAQFDIGALQATLDHFGLDCPEFDYLCTYRVAERIWPDLPNHRLNTLAAHIGHEFHHHHAKSDAEAAGRVLLAMMKEVNARTPSELLQRAGVVPRRLRQQNCYQHRLCRIAQEFDKPETPVTRTIIDGNQPELYQ